MAIANFLYITSDHLLRLKSEIFLVVYTKYLIKDKVNSKIKDTSKLLKERSSIIVGRCSLSQLTNKV